MCMVNVVCDILTDGGVKTFNFLVVLLRLKTFLFCLFIYFGNLNATSFFQDGARLGQKILQRFIYSFFNFKKFKKIKLVVVAIRKEKRPGWLFFFRIVTTTKIKRKKFGISDLFFSPPLIQRKKHK